MISAYMIYGLSCCTTSKCAFSFFAKQIIWNKKWPSERLHLVSYLQTTIVNGHASPQVENSILNNITNGNGNTTHIESLQNLKATEVLINGEGHIVAEVQPLCEDTTPPKPQPSTLETNGKSSDSGIEVSRSRDNEVALETKRYFKTLTQTTQV